MPQIAPDSLPLELITAIRDNLGKLEADQWLHQACKQANHYANTWNLTPKTALTGGALSLCILSDTNLGEQTVLKIPTDIISGQREISTLTAWNGNGCPQIYETDDSNGVFLMEYLHQASQPITAHEAYQLANRLHLVEQTADHRYQKLSDNMNMRIEWAEERFAVEKYSHQRSDLQLAKNMYQKLLSTTTHETLLHGDFQRKNLIQTHDGLKTIDPYACIGDPAFDAAFWLALVHHDAPLQENLQNYPAAKESNEYHRFLCWTWAISVIENRPHEKQGTQERQHFINAQRGHAHRTAGMI